MRLFAAVNLLLLLLPPAAAQHSQPRAEIPIDRCDVLPVVKVLVAGEEMNFLVDTAATSMLNIRSFSKGASKEVQITSWSGTAATSAREVTISQLALGDHRIARLKLPAIDLSPIGEACGGRIDGILGIDLLERLGARLDLKRWMAGLDEGQAEVTDNQRIREFRESMLESAAAFNRGDVGHFQRCLDPDVVLFTPWADVEGREAMIDYLRTRYFSLDPPARIEFHPRDVRLIGDAVWHGYDFTLELPDERFRGRGMIVCRKTGERWQLLSMHNSLVQTSPSPPTLEVESLRKQDLPRGFPFYMLDKGFAVLRVKVSNSAGEIRSFDLQSLEIRDRKGKRLQRARSTDIAPEIMKLYLAASRGVMGEAHTGPGPTPRQWERVPTVSPNPSPRTVSANRGEQLRTLLESYELQAGQLEAGASVEGFIYLKSKKSGRDLAGSRVGLEGTTAVVP